MSTLSSDVETALQQNREPNFGVELERITINEAAELIGVHRNTIRNLILRQELPAERIGARIIRIRKQDVLNLLTPYERGEFGVWSNR